MPKPKDFTESAVKMTNPDEVKVLLDFLADKQKDKETNLDELANLDGYKAINDKIVLCDEAIERCQSQIRETIEEHGSYQSLEDERYGVKYARRTAIYHLEPFKTNFPKFVGLCVRESIDVTALKGQVKGKLITESQLEDAGVLTYDTGYSFYVR